MKSPIRLLAADIDGTLLNPEFQISTEDLAALRSLHDEKVEIVLVTGRRHAFARPIAEMLGIDLWIISSNGAITRSLQGETFHRDMLTAESCRKLCGTMQEYRGNTVLTFDTENKGAIVLEHMRELNGSIRRWLEKNLQFIDFVIPIEDSITTDPVQAMFCGPLNRMHQALGTLESSGLDQSITVSRTEYPERDLSIVDVLNHGCSKGEALRRWCKHRNIDRDEVMAIGDNYNDVEMLAFAGRPFIMGNACEDLRSRGWEVTLSNSHNGLAAAINQVLNSKVQI